MTARRGADPQGGADTVALFREVAASHRRCFWLDGGGAHAWARRRSVLGWLEPDDVSLSYDAATRTVTRHVGGRAEVVGEDVFTVLESELDAGGSRADWFGYLGYAARPDLPAEPGPLPDAVWMRPSHVRRHDHPRPPRPRTPPAAGGGPGATASTSVPPDYLAAYDAVQEQLHAGNTYEVNLTYREELIAERDPAEVYLVLRGTEPAPYAGFLQHDEPGARAWLLSASPERYALVLRDRTIETRPIKGTAPRDPDPARDAELARSLVEEERFRAENLMIVDLLRHDLSLVCETGSVEVPSLMHVESYPAVHQLVSTVRGRLRSEVSTVQALRALFPAGSMTGAPKRRTMEVIAAVEQTPRGPYAGAFGHVGGDGRADLGVVIRSLSTAGDGRWCWGTGGGVTVHSAPQAEYDETRWKAERLRRALDRPAGPD